MPSLGSGGAERQFSIVARHLVERGHDMQICVWREDFEYGRPDVPIHVIHRNKKRQILPAVLRLAKIIRKVQPTVVYSQVNFTNILVGIALIASRWRCRYVCRLTVSPKMVVPRLLIFWSRLVYRRADLLVACSVGVAREAIEYLGVDGSKVVVLENLADVGHICAQANAVEASIAKGRKFTLINVGRFVPQKNQALLLRAMSQLKTHSIELWMIGDGPLHSDFVDLCSNLGISDRVHWLGRKANPYPYIHAADCLVLASDFEGFPNVIIEAMICRTPVISTDCPFGPAEIISHRETGWLTPVGDADKLAQLIEEVMHDPSARKRIADTAFEQAAARFDGKVRADDFERAIRGSVP